MKILFKIQRFADYINGTSGNDSYNIGSYWDNSYFTQIDGGDGNDTLISNYAHYDTLIGGNGNDYLRSTGGYGASRVDMFGGPGNDTMIVGVGSGAYLDGGDGDDVVSLSGNYSTTTINGGLGNDTVYFRGPGAYPGHVFTYASGDGEDVLLQFNGGDDTISLNGDEYYTQKSGDDVIIKVGSGSMTIKNFTSSPIIKNGIYNPNQVVENYDYYAYITTAEGDDVINNYAAYSTIYAGSGNDVINNGGNNSYIDGGDGDDFLGNDTSQTTMIGGNGNDSIINYGSNVTIDTGAGADSISIGGSNDVIIAGTDNDTIITNGYYNLINYASGDGNDVIIGFNSSDTFNLTSGSISSSLVSGNDLILRIGTNNVTIKDVLSQVINLKIGSSPATTLKVEDLPIWRISYGTATYGTESNTLITIYGLSSSAADSDLSLSGTTVTVKNHALSASNTVSINDGYTLALASDVTKATQKSASWNIYYGTANYRETTTAGYSLSPDGKSIVYNSESEGESIITIYGLYSYAADSDLSLSGTTVTVKNHALSTSNTVSINDGYTLALASDVTKATQKSASWNIYYGTANYRETTTAGYSLSPDGKSIVYNSESEGESIITIDGLSSSAADSDLSLSGTTVTVKNHALSASKTVTISEGYILALASDVAKSTTSAAKWTVSGGTATYKGSTSAGYELSADGKSISYSSASEGATLIEITGLKSTATADSISLSGSTVKIKAAALDPSNTVSISGNYTLALASDVTTPTTSAAKWTVSNGTATYNTSISAGYTLSSDGKSISYNAASTGTTLATISGLKSTATTSDFVVNGNVVTIKNSALDSTKTVTISEDYTLALASDVTTAKETSGTWSLNGTTATYNAIKSAGYELSADGKSISYNNNSSTQTFITVNGITSLNGISLNGNVVTVPANVTVNGAGYEFNMTGDGKLTNISSEAAINGGSGNDTIDLSSGKALVKFSAGDGNDVIYGYNSNNTLNITSNYTTSVDGSDAIIYVGTGSMKLVNAAKSPVKIFNGTDVSTITIGSETIEPVTVPNDDIYQYYSTVNGSDTISNSDSRNAYIYLNDYGDNLAIIEAGATGLKEVNAGNSGDSLANYSTSANVTLNGGDASDVIINGGRHATINGSGENDTISLIGGNALIQFSEKEGNDIIYGYTSDNTINITKGDYDTGVSGNDVIITVSDNYKLRLKDAKGQILNIVDEQGQFVTIDSTVKDKFVVDITGVTLNADYEGIFDLSEFNVNKVIGSAATSKVTINGNNSANTLVGGKSYDSIVGLFGNDSLKGNNGDDTLDGGFGDDTLTGDAGKDFFIYDGRGNDIITDYREDKDTIKIERGKIKSTSLTGDDVILKIGTGSLTIKDANDKIITIVDSNDDTINKVFKDELIIDDTDPNSVTVEDTFKFVDATARTTPVKITANTEANTIVGGAKADTIYGLAGADFIDGGAGKDFLFGGSGKDTLYGNKGNDVLTGGKGKDTFIVGNGEGNDTITDYTEGEDTLKIRAGAIKSASIIGSTKDVVLYFNNGSVTLQDAKDKTISIVDKNGKSYATVPTDPIIEHIEIDNDTASPVKLAADVKSVDASARSKPLRITANELPNTILGGTGADTINGGKGNDSINGGAGSDSLVGGEGADTLLGGKGHDFLSGGKGHDLLSAGKGNDTLTGGKGNDTLTGGDGQDVFVYSEGDGNDVIKDYRSEDLIYTDIASSASTVGNDIIITVGTGSIKLLGAAGIRPRIITMSSNYEERSIMDYDLEEIMLPTTDYNIGEVDTSNALTKSLTEFTLTKSKD